MTPLPTTDGGFRCIYADPPWRFKFRGSTEGNARVIENSHYRTMDLADVKALPVKAVASKDCWLFLWVTWPFLEEGLRVMNRWGFRFSSAAFVWPKLKPSSSHALFLDASDFIPGTGYTTRKATEVCLLGRRGSPKRLDAGICDLVIAPRRQHSRKPDSIYPMIERFCDGPRLEMFARTTRDGWSVWGNETDKFTQEDVA